MIESERAPVSVGLALRELLRDPPWTKKATIPLVLSGADAITTRLGDLHVPTWWAPHDRERRIGLARFIPERARERFGASAGQIEGSLKPDERAPLHLLLGLPDDDCARLFCDVRPDAFDADTNALDAIVARLGARAAKGLARRATDLGLRNKVFQLLLHVGTPLAVPALLDAFLRLQTLRGHAKRVMTRFRATMLEAIVPLAVGADPAALGLELAQKHAELVRSARLALHYLSGAGGFDAITNVAARLGVKDAWFRIRREDPLMGAKTPAIAPAVVAAARPTWMGGDPFSKDECERLVMWLAMLDWETPRLATLHTDVLAASLDATARALWDVWVERTCMKSDLWIAHATFELGSRETIQHVRDQLREWRAHFQTPGIEVLRAAGLSAVRHLGDDIASAALELLGEIAVEGSSKSQEGHAREVIHWVDDQLEEVDDLDDRLVPSLGLDLHGKTRFDFGPRAFIVSLDTSLAIHVADETGVTLPKLPSPKKSDDPEKAKDAKARMSSLARDARILVARLQNRMQAALTAQKRWSSEAFFSLLASHPVVGCFVRGLVWMAFDESDTPIASFRLCEDGSLSDVDDRPFSLPEKHGVRLLHPAMIDAGACAKWSHALADYEVIQPFAQLGWPIVRLDDAERASTSLARRYTLSTLTLSDHGWRRGPVSRTDGVRTAYEKQVRGGLRLLVVHEPVGSKPLEPMSIHALELRVQRLETLDDACLPWSAVDPVSTSEALHDVELAITSPSA